MHPEYQERVYAEISQAGGPEKFLHYIDADKTPLLNATIKEVDRRGG
jgi:hypothetical protein